MDVPRDIIRRHCLQEEDAPAQEEPLASDGKGGSQNNTEDGSPKEAQDAKEEVPKEVAYTPIKALSTFNYDWRIKARIVKKHEKRTWKNARSEGLLLNIELMDTFGTQIQATFFKDAVEKFDSLLKEGHVSNHALILCRSISSPQARSKSRIKSLLQSRMTFASFSIETQISKRWQRTHLSRTRALIS